MPAVSEDQVRDALAVVRWQARAFRHVPPGIDIDDLESVGGEALAKAAAEFDAGSGLEFKTFARYAAKRAMENFIKSARTSHKRVGHFPADPETGVQMVPADRAAATPDRLAEGRELVPAKKQYITVSRVEATSPDSAEVAHRVTEYQNALHAALTPADVGDVVKMVVGKAKGGSLRAAKMVIDLAAPAKAGITVQQAVVVQPRDLE